MSYMVLPGMTLRRYDLNLLTILDALLRHRNVTRAGKELGLSQSATSHALLRLRNLLSDALLVPSGREMMLTHKAEAIARPLEGVLELIERLLDADAFDPATSIRRFKIGTADYVATLILPEIAREVERTAPQVTVQTTWTGKDMPTKLRSNQLDIALVPRDSLDEKDLHSVTLFTDELVVVAATDHPEIGRTLDLATFIRLPHVTFRNDEAGPTSFADHQLAQNHIRPRDVLLVPNFLMVPFIVASSKHISLMHRRLAERMMKTIPIKLLRPPFATDKLHIEAYWTHDANSDPGHKWFREMLVGAATNGLSPVGRRPARGRKPKLPPRAPAKRSIRSRA